MFLLYQIYIIRSADYVSVCMLIYVCYVAFNDNKILNKVNTEFQDLLYFLGILILLCFPSQIDPFHLDTLEPFCYLLLALKPP